MTLEEVQLDDPPNENSPDLSDSEREHAQETKDVDDFVASLRLYAERESSHVLRYERRYYEGHHYIRVVFSNATLTYVTNWLDKS